VVAQMAATDMIEGTGAELARLLGQMPGRRFRLIELPDGEGQQEPAAERSLPFYETATADEWTTAFRLWAEGHRADRPPLSEEAVSRDSIYEGRA
jgi:hypothetical protein